MSEIFTLYEAVRDQAGAIVDLRILEFNPAAERVTGKTRGQVVGKLVSEVFAGGDPAQAEAMKNVARTRRPFHAEVYGRIARRWFDLRVWTPAKDRVAALRVDITERKQAEESLRNANEELRTKTEQLESLNAMLQGKQDQLLSTYEELLAREQNLRELNVTLERKVAERTAALKQRAKQLQRLTLELTQAEDRERRRIAVLLHEDLQQQIVGARFHLSRLRNRKRYDAETVETIDEVLKQATEKSRSLSHDLSPLVPYMNDLSSVLQWLASQTRVQHGLHVHVDAPPGMTVRSDSLGTFLFRTVQELLFNVVKHARTDRAAIRVRRSKRHVLVYVFDRGRGFDPASLRHTPGLGLLSIRERVELLGGQMHIKSGKGRGSIFRIVVPDRNP